MHFVRLYIDLQKARNLLKVEHWNLLIQILPIKIVLRHSMY